MSEIRTPPKKLVDMNPRWMMTTDGEVYGIEYDCPCGLGAACPTGDGRQIVPTKTSWAGKVCADSARRGWDLSGTSWETLTLAPSILAYGMGRDPHWHGWLRDGVLVSC